MISIIVPVYNSERWVQKCVESLINQTYMDIEILLINDGSKDNSINILRDFEKKDSRIRVFDKNNEGVSKARNLGIQEARGEFIQFVDSDDYIEPDMCEKMLKAIQGADMAICGMRIHQDGKILREPHLPDKTYLLRESIDNYFELRKINLGPCNKLYRKNKITDLFKEDISLGEDTLFVLSYMNNINIINSISDILYNVSLDNNNSLNRSSKADKFDRIIELRKTEEDFLSRLYNDASNSNQIFELYLLDLHAFFLSMTIEKNDSIREFIQKYTSDVFLTERIKKATATRMDYKIFKWLYIKKAKWLILLFFKFKTLLLKF